MTMQITTAMGTGQAEKRLEEIAIEIARAPYNKAWTGEQKTKRLDELMRESDEIEGSLKSYKRALQFRAGSEVGEPAPLAPGTKFKSPRARDATTGQWQAMWSAIQQKMPSYSIQVDGGSFRDNLGLKAALSETSFGGLPAVIRPELTQGLPYEPDRLFDHYIPMAMDSPSIEYLVHTGNANPAAVVPELGVKPDLGMQVSARIVQATKIAALASVSYEAFHDFGTFASWVPVELDRAVIDAESNWLINDPVNGLLWQTGATFNRFVGADTYLDAIEKAIDDIRVGPMFATADTIVLHPNTFGLLKRQKNTLNSYILVASPQSGLVDRIWDCRVVQSTKVPMNYAIVFDSKVAILGFTRQALTIDMNMYSDTAWTTNQIQWRAEERIAVGYQKPKAINIVEGFPGAGS